MSLITRAFQTGAAKYLLPAAKAVSAYSIQNEYHCFCSTTITRSDPVSSVASLKLSGSIPVLNIHRYKKKKTKYLVCMLFFYHLKILSSIFLTKSCELA